MATAAHAALVGPTPAGRVRPGTVLLSLATGAAAWETSSFVLQFPFQPSLLSIVEATWRMTVSGEIPGHLGASLTVLVLGYGLAAFMGVPAGLAMGRYRWLAIVFDPYLDALLAVPNLLLVPIFFGVFGLDRSTHVAVVFLYSFVVIVTMTRSGLATVSRRYVEMAQVFGASELQVFRQVLLPGALPTIMAGLRVGISRAVRALIGAEMLLGPLGLGALLRQYGNRFDAASVFGILLVLVGLALVANHAVQLADRRFNHWAN